MVLIYAFHYVNRPRYVTNLAEHPFAVLQNYQAAVDDARAHCLPLIVQPGKSRKIAARMFSDRFHRLTWHELERSDFEAVGFPEGCASRYPDFRAYVDAEQSDGMVDAVLVALRTREGSRGLFVERQRLPIVRLMPEA
jgi:hypothetical protein